MVATIASIAHETSFASKAERERLRLSVSRRVLRLLRLISEQGRPRSYERIVLPLYRLPGLETQLASTLSLFEIAAQHGLTLGRATERIGHVNAPPEVALHLAITADQRVLRLERVTATTDGVPIEWRVVFMRADEPRSA